jgi:FkbM family methyltransferase
MPQIPFYSDNEPKPHGWQRASMSPPSATEKRYDSLLDTAIGYARRGYWSSRWILSNPARCVDLVGARFHVAVARTAGQVVELDGVKVQLRPHYSLRLARALLARTYAGAERQLVRDALEDDDVVMEVGSGIGVIAALCARRLGSNRIVAFEAHPAMVEAARATFALNGIAPQLEHCALGCVAGIRTLHASDTLGDTGPGRYARKFLVPGRTLRDALRAHRPSFLIIGIGGGECQLIKDVIELGIRKVLIAFHPIEIGTPTICRAQRAFAQAGYVPVNASADGNRVLYRRDAAVPTVIDSTPSRGA